MRQEVYYVLITSLFVGGCEKHSQPQKFGKMQEAPSVKVATSSSLIDYKKEKYCFFIGQHKDSINKVIELRYNYLADDGIINDDGVTHYMNIGEDLMKSCNNEEILPALFFTTNKKEVTAFSCSIVCSLYNNDRVNIIASLDSLAPYFSAFKVKSNRRQLANKFRLVVKNNDFIEEFKIDTISRKYQFVFSYEKSLKQNKQ